MGGGERSQSPVRLFLQHPVYLLLEPLLVVRDIGVAGRLVAAKCKKQAQVKPYTGNQLKRVSEPVQMAQHSDGTKTP